MTEPRQESGETGRIVLQVQDLAKHFPVKHGLFGRVSGQVYALDGVSFSVREGETLGIVGESGCGKSTLGKTVLRLLQPTAGRIVLRGHDITFQPERKLRRHRREMQMVFQDPYPA